MWKPTITDVTYSNSEQTGVNATFDGKVKRGVPLVSGNRFYGAIKNQNITIGNYVSIKATMQEYRLVRDAEMDYVDIKKANAGKFDDFTGPEKASYKQWQRDMRDSPQDQNVIDAVALVAQDDETGLKALFPTKPSIIA